MNNDIFISVFIASRERVSLLEKCIKSFYDNASRPENIEFLVLVDNDDRKSIDFLLNIDYAYSQNLTIIIRNRGETLNDYYNNYAAKCAQGKLIWGVNDECECKTENWDLHLFKAYKDFIITQPDRIFYLVIDDSTHFNDGVSIERGCCFPVLTKEAVSTLGFFMPPNIEWEGGDVALWNIFKTLSVKYAMERILVCEDIKVSHDSVHNGMLEADEVQIRSKDMSKKGMLLPEELNYCSLLIFKEIVKKHSDSLEKYLWDFEREYCKNQEKAVENI